MHRALCLLAFNKLGGPSVGPWSLWRYLPEDGCRSGWFCQWAGSKRYLHAVWTFAECSCTYMVRGQRASLFTNGLMSVGFQINQGIAPSVRALADTRQIGKLTREQFALAMHLIQQKVGKGIDPPQTLTADMIPPSERGTPVPVGHTHTHTHTYLHLLHPVN